MHENLVQHPNNNISICNIFSGTDLDDYRWLPLAALIAFSFFFNLGKQLLHKSNRMIACLISVALYCKVKLLIVTIIKYNILERVSPPSQEKSQLEKNIPPKTIFKEYFFKIKNKNGKSI